MNRFFARLFAFILVAVIGLTGCSSGTTLFSDTMSGDYTQDTLTVIHRLEAVVNMPIGSQEQIAAQTEARQLINDFVARYRRDKSTASLASFTSMQTALNALAGHYNAYPNLPVSDKLKDRLARAFKLTELALKRGS